MCTAHVQTPLILFSYCACGKQILSIILRGVLVARQVCMKCKKHSCKVHIPVSILTVWKSFDMLFVETLETHSLTQAIINIWMEKALLNVCSVIHCGLVGDYFIQSKKRQFIWICAYFTTRRSWLCWLIADCTHKVNLIY